MHASITLLFAILLTFTNAMPGFLKTPVCRKDQCQQAVQPNRKHVHFSSARRDCSSFLARTITPRVVTTISTTYTTLTSTAPVQTVTSTELTTTSTTTTVSHTITQISTTVTSIIAPPTDRKRHAQAFDRRKVIKTSRTIPSYASACTNPAAYSSACGCLGIQPTTVTLPARTSSSTTTITSSETQQSTETDSTTTTETVVSTVQVTSTIGTSTISGTLSTATFILEAKDPSHPENTYYVLGGAGGNHQAFYTANIAAASRFSLDENGALVNGGERGASPNYLFGAGFAIPTWTENGYNPGQPETVLACSLPLPAAGELSCSASEFHNFIYFTDEPTSSTVALGRNPPADGQHLMTLTAIPLFVPAP